MAASSEVQLQFQSVPQEQQGIGGTVVEQAVGSGTDPAIATIVPNTTQTLHNVNFNKTDSCCFPVAERKYFKVLENGYEANYPYGAICCLTDGGQSLCYMGDPGTGLFCPDNCFCPYMDHVHRNYFDRGIYDNRGCPRAIGCVRGDPETFGGEIKYQCCKQPCCDCFNSCLACYFEGMCGERIRYSPCQTSCFCCPNRTSNCDSCFCLFGPMPGQPKLLLPFLTCLAPGEGKKLSEKLEAARSEWKVRANVN